LNTESEVDYVYNNLESISF